MVKSYLRYDNQVPSFGCIVNSSTISGAVAIDATGTQAITATIDTISVWNIKQNTLIHRLTVEAPLNHAGNKSVQIQVTFLAQPHQQQSLKHTSNNVIAAGYSDGTIRVWSLTNYALLATYHGHSSAITCLTYNSDNTQLASGSADTQIIVWDAIAEHGLYRFIGHKAAITSLCWLSQRGHNHIISSSKDCLVKFWDLDTQHCVQTLTEHSNEVWSIAVNSSETRLITGSVDKVLRVYKLVAHDDSEAVAAQAQTTTLMKTATSTINALLSSSIDSGIRSVAVFYGSIVRSSNKRVVQLQYNNNNSLLLCSSVDKLVDVYVVRTDDQITKKVKRRLQRLREKQRSRNTAAEADTTTTAAATAAVTTEQQPGDEFDAIAPLRCSKKVLSFSLQAQHHNKQKRSSSSSSGSVHERLLLGLANNTLVVYDIDVKQSKDDDSTTATTTTTTTTTTATTTATAAATVDDNDNDVSLYSHQYEVALAGHRTAIRTTCINTDNTLLLTTSTEHIKIYNLNSQQCVRTLTTSSQATCCCFVPGSKHVIIGTKAGTLEVWDIGSGNCLEIIQAHYKEAEAGSGSVVGAAACVWCVDVRPDQRGIATGGSDKQVKFWDFELILPPQRTATTASTTATATATTSSSRQLSLILTRTLTLTDDVLCLKHSADSRFIACGLLDSTVKIFYFLDLKFYLSLYGHKLPVLSIDISSDSSLLITGSADKSIKIWGLDFGDLHRSIHAHNDSIMAIKFIANTHLFVSCSKDKLIKQFDADTFTYIQTLGAHSSEVWALDVTRGNSSRNSDNNAVYVVSVGNDKSVHVYTQTEEQLFLEEERQRELDAVHDASSSRTHGDLNNDLTGSNLRLTTDNSNNSNSVALSVAQHGSSMNTTTAETQDGCERLMDAMDLASEEEKRWIVYREELVFKTNAAAAAKNSSSSSNSKKKATASTGLERLINSVSAPTADDDDNNNTTTTTTAIAATPASILASVVVPPVNPLLRGYTASGYVHNQLTAIKSTDIDDALLILPFEYAMKLITYLDVYITQHAHVELCTHCLLFLLGMHHAQMINNQTHVATLSDIRHRTRHELMQTRDTIGYNMAALKFMQSTMTAQAGLYSFGPDAAAAAATVETAISATASKKQKL